MLTRIQADELKAMIDKFTVKQTASEVSDASNHEFFVRQRSDGLFWGGLNWGWVPTFKNAMGYVDTLNAWKGIDEWVKSPYRCRVVSNYEVDSLPYVFVLFAEETMRYWCGPLLLWQYSCIDAVRFNSETDALDVKQYWIDKGTETWTALPSLNSKPLKISKGF